MSDFGHAPVIKFLSPDKMPTFAHIHFMDDDEDYSEFKRCFLAPWPTPKDWSPRGEKGIVREGKQ